MTQQCLLLRWVPLPLPLHFALPAAFRLRHVQSVTLKRFDPSCHLQRDAQLYYELWRGLPDGAQQLLYVSEQVTHACKGFFLHVLKLRGTLQETCSQNSAKDLSAVQLWQCCISLVLVAQCADASSAYVLHCGCPGQVADMCVWLCAGLVPVAAGPT